MKIEILKQNINWEYVMGSNLKKEKMQKKFLKNL